MSNPNPYANGLAVQSEEPSKKLGFCWFALLGMMLLFPGYLGSMLMAFQMYAIEGGGPFDQMFSHVYQEIAVLCFAIMVTTTGGLLIGGNRFENILVVAYIMCPIIVVSFALGCPLRLAKRNWVLPVAAIYLFGGMILAGASITFLVKSYGTESIGAVGAVLGAEVGLAMAVGALLKLWHDQPGGRQAVGLIGNDAAASM